MKKIVNQTFSKLLRLCLAVFIILAAFGVLAKGEGRAGEAGLSREASVQQGALFHLNRLHPEWDVSASMAILENSEYAFDKDKVLSGSVDDYFSYQSADFVRASQANVDIWLRLAFKADFEMQEEQWFFQVTHPYFEYLKLYLLDSERKQVAYFERFKRQKDDPDEIAYPSHTFTLNLENEQEYYLYINLRSLNKLVSQFFFSTGAELVKNNTLKALLDGGFYSALLLIFIYNLFIFIRLKDIVHFYYAGYVLMSGICFFGIDSLARQYLGSESFFNSDFSQALSCLLIFSFFLLFIQSNLNIKQHFPIINKLFYLYFLCVLLVIPVIYFAESYLLFLITYTALVLYVLLTMIPLIRLSFRKNINAIVILIAYFLPIFFAFFFIWKDIGLIDMSQDDIAYIVKYAIVAEVLILTFALVNRFLLDRKLSYQLQKESLMHAQESDRLKHEFLATLSHEFRTPMNGVQGSLDLIAFAKDDKERQLHIENAKKSAGNMINMIDDVLQFIEVDGNTDLQNCYFQLETLIHQIEEKYRPRFDKKQVEFKVTNVALGSEFWADYQRIFIALKHLLDNAAKFTEEGQVELLISDRYFGSRCELHFRIIDSGVGIPFEVQKDIFSFFRQGDIYLSRRFGGLGLGLTIAKKQIDNLHGKLTFESSLEKGSVFIATIPVNPVSNQVLGTSDKQEKVVRRVSKKGEKTDPVLVVEDNALNRSVIEAMLQNLGYSVELCGNGREALDWLAKHRAAMVLMDCQMPVLDGFEASRQLRASEFENSNLAVIAVTGNISEPEVAACYDAGMDEVLSKPIQKIELENCLKRWVNS